MGIKLAEYRAGQAVLVEVPVVEGIEDKPFVFSLKIILIKKIFVLYQISHLY